MDWWSTVLPYVPASGLTAGGAVTVFFLLQARGIIRTNREFTELQATHEKLIVDKDLNHALVLTQKDKAYEDLEKDRDYYRKGYELQRDRSDILNGKITDEVVPLLGVSVALLKALPQPVEGGDTK